MLQKVAAKKLTIEVQQEHKKNLIFCPSKVLDDGRDAVKKYLKNKEFNMSTLFNISSVEVKLKAMLWLFDQKEKEVNVLYCCDQKAFFKQKESDLYNFFTNPKLEHTETVYLDNCELETIPFKKASLPNLKSIKFK